MQQTATGSLTTPPSTGLGTAGAARPCSKSAAVAAQDAIAAKARARSKSKSKEQKPTAPGIPRRSPIQVLTRPDPA